MQIQSLDARVDNRAASSLFRRPWFLALLALSLMIMFAAAWRGRFCINSDGVSYLDMARRLLHGKFDPLFHPYWSPLYPLLLALAVKFAAIHSVSEVLLAHAVNLAIAIAALLSFCFLLKEWLDQETDTHDTHIFSRAAFGLTLFLVGAIKLVDLSLLTPDLLVFGLVFLIAALVCRLTNGRGGITSAAALGIALALGYFAKSAVLPLGTFLLILLQLPGTFEKVPQRRLFGLATLVFILITAPYIFVLSMRQHKFTFGESGRLNYAWLVQQNVPVHAGWVQGSPDAGTPLHPLRVLMLHPPVLEFKSPTPGTSPLWYDPSYYYQGLRVSFSPAKQLRRFSETLSDLRDAFGGAAILLPAIAGLIALLLAGLRRTARSRIRATGLLVWCFVAIAMYSMVHVESRYTAAWVVIFLFAAIDLARSFVTPAGLFMQKSFLVLISLLPLSNILLTLTFPAPYVDARTHIAVAGELNRLGLQGDDQIAVVGDPFDVYYAHVASLHIVATIGWNRDENPKDQDYASFWSLDPTASAALMQKLREVSVRAIVSTQPCSSASFKGCLPLGNTHYSVFLLDSSSSN